MYRYLDALVVRAAVSGPDRLPAQWPDLTEPRAGAVSWRPWFRQVLTIPEFAAALGQASPALADRVRAIRDGAQVPDRDARRVVVSVMRYLLRATGRATPYGLFAAVAAARVADTGAIRLGCGHRPVIRIRAEWLAAVIDRLEGDPRLQPHLQLRANNLLIERDDFFVLEYRASHSTGGAPTHLHVRATGPVRAALALAADPIRWHQLVEKLAVDPISTDTVNALLTQMVAQRLMLTNLRPPMTVTDSLDWVARRLESLSDAGMSAHASGGVEPLRRLVAIAARHDASPSWPAANEQRRRLNEALSGVYSITESAAAVDLRLDCDLTLPHTVVEEAARAAGLLIRLGRPAAGGWAAWHGRFLERYGPRAVVPVLDVVDRNIGIGYPAGYHDAPPALAAAVTNRDRKLLTLAQRAALARHREIVLDDATIGDLADEGAGMSIQPGTELTVRVQASSMAAVQRGDFRLSIIGVSRNVGTTTGRLLDLFDPADRERIARHYATVPTATRDALVAQITAVTRYTATQDVARAPQVLPLLIPVGEFYENRDDRIPLADIAVTVDERRVYLVSMSRRRVVEPMVLNAVEPVHHTLPVVRFLAEAPTALTTPCAAFDWGAAASLPFLPALRHGRTILSSARWLLPAADLPGRAASWQDWNRALTAWLGAVACPTTVYLGDGDQRIRLDLVEPTHRALLRDQLSRTDTVLLRAAPAADADRWISGHAHEIVIPLASTMEPAPPLRLPDALPTVAACEYGHLPGCGDRLYLKLYGHPDWQTSILTQHLPFLLGQLDPKQCWWFLRYGDPDPHLRLRLTGPVDIAAVGAWIKQLRSAGLTARAQFDTDYPETARFGGPTAITAAEQYFAADSAAALAQLAATSHPRTADVTALTAASLLDLTIGFIGKPTDAMRWLVEHTRTHRPAPARTVYAQAVQLSNPYSRAHLTAMPAGEQILTSWQHRRHALAAYRDALRAAGIPSATALLPDLLHLHHTRIVGPDLDSERRCLHLARAAALSWSTRTGSHL